MNNIVIVDDDLMFSTRIAKTVEAIGYQPQVFKDVDDAVQAAENSSPAIVIINIASKRLDGVGAVRRFKEDLRTQTAPVLGYAGHKEKEYRQNAIEAGVDRVVSNSEITFKLPTILAEMVQGPKTT